MGYDPDFAWGTHTVLEVKGDGRINTLVRYLPKCLGGLDSIDFVGEFLVVGAKPCMRHEPARKGSIVGPGIVCYRESDRWMMTRLAWTWCRYCDSPGLQGVGYGDVLLTCHRHYDELEVVHELSDAHIAIKGTWWQAISRFRDATG